MTDRDRESDDAPLPRFTVRPIGWVRRPSQPADPTPGAFYDPEPEAVLEILPRWADGLAGIEEFSHLIVLFWLDRARRPRRLSGAIRPEGRDDVPPVGLFATRSPHRPNPIGIACPRLLRREGNRLIVSGIDAWDGTPIVDVKGYFPRDDMRPDARVPDWLESLWRRHDEERGDNPD